MRSFFAIMIFLLCSVTLLPPSVQATHGPTLTIRDDSTGGDCTSVGTWHSHAKTCTLTADLTGHIVIGANAVTLDCDGHTITGPGTTGRFNLFGGATGIDFGSFRFGVTVRNCNVTNFDMGFRLFYSSGNKFTQNVVTGNSIGFVVGFNGEPSNNNLFRGNTANSNEVGLDIIGSSENILKDNTANNNIAGIQLLFSSSNILSGNTANGNSYSGFFMAVSSGNTLLDNTANSNGRGFVLSLSSNDNILNGNTASGNVYAGFFVGNVQFPSPSVRNMITDNLITLNFYGVYICSSLRSQNTIAPNTLIDNQVDTFVDTGC